MGYFCQYRSYKMVDIKSKGDMITTTGLSEVTNIYDTARQNYIRILDEFRKAEP
jgi:hypothetical protein